MARIAPCAGCAKPIQIGTGSLGPGRSQCIDCRRREIVHGSVKRGYRKGCRCDECRESLRAEHFEYRQRRKARTGRAQSRRSDREYATRQPCSSCGKTTRSRRPEPICSPCSQRSRRSIAITQTRRRAIYDRDEWICGFCGYEVDHQLDGTDPFGPTLDHIMPRSKGGSDDEANLRLVHRYCNAARSNRDALTIEQVA